MTNPAFRVGAIHIIESLPPGELRTGERLLDVLESIPGAAQTTISLHLWRERTRAQFLHRLAEIASDVRKRRRAPLLHIETHGDPRGIELASGEHLDWADLKQPLTDINILCRLNLLVILAACDGADLLHVIQPIDRAPVWAVIGPSRQVTAGEIEDAHRAFYQTLFSSGDGAPAWLEMNAAVKRGDSPFRFFRAERMFQEVMTGYFQELCADQAITDRVGRLVQQAAQEGGTSRGLRAFERKAFEYLQDHRGRFDETKRHFFFFDLCPENSGRFEVTLEDCLTPPPEAV